MTEQQIDLTAYVAWAASRKKPHSVSELSSEVLKAVPGTSESVVWNAIKEAIRLGFIKKIDSYIEGQVEHGPRRGERVKRFGFDLIRTEEGDKVARSVRQSDYDEQARRDKYCYHVGVDTHKVCGKNDTGTKHQSVDAPLVAVWCFTCRMLYSASSKKMGIMSQKSGRENGPTVQTELRRDLMMAAKTQKQLEELTLVELVELYNSKAEKPVASFKNKAAGIKAILKLNGITPAKKERKPKSDKPSAMGLLREHFKSRKTGKLEDLMALTGKEAGWIHTAMAILKNPERCGKAGLVETTYDRATKTFSR